MDCTATTKKGAPCRNKAMPDREVCKQHSGDANVGKRSGLTVEIIEKVCTAIRAGAFIEPACVYAGIGESTFYSWRERGEADIEADVQSLHREFVEQTTRARAEAEVEAVALVRRAATGRPAQYDESGQVTALAEPGDWRAAAWYLERAHRDRYGKVHEISGPGGGPITLAAAGQILDEALEEEQETKA